MAWFGRRRRTGTARGVATPTAPATPDTPVEPDDELARLWPDAVGTDPARRAAVQRRLASRPGIAGRVAADLQLASQQRRIVAAEWLGRLGDTGQVAALATALSHERIDKVRSALLDALAALGEPLGRHVDLPMLLRAAHLSASRPLPPLLVDFPWHDVPPLRLSDADGVLDPDLFQHLVRLAVRARRIEPDAQLRHFADQVWREDAEGAADACAAHWQRHGYDPRLRGLLAVVHAFGGEVDLPGDTPTDGPAAAREASREVPPRNPLPEVERPTYR